MVIYYRMPHKEVEAAICTQLLQQVVNSTK